MDILITEWALQSYLDLVARQAFTNEEYGTVIRPDVRRLESFPADPKFNNGKFWSPAPDPRGGVLRDGYKMKWHNVGNGKVQLRLPVGLLGDAVLCQAYVKQNEKHERRMLAKFKTHLQLVRLGRHTVRGKLS